MVKAATEETFYAVDSLVLYSHVLEIMFSVCFVVSGRFAIPDGPTMPIIGEGDEEANDR